MFPRQSRTAHTEQLGDEASVYDWARAEVHALNPTAAFVWRRCDGATSPEAIAAGLHREMGVPEADAVVDLTLRQLARVRLLELPVESPSQERPAPTRRWLLERGLAAAMLPAVYSILAPSPLEAQSPGAAPRLTAVLPNQGIAGTTVAATLAGANFVAGATTVSVSGAGVAINSVVVDTVTSLTVNFVLDPAAAVGARNVTVTTAGGTSGALTFTITPPPPPDTPTLISLAPNAGIVGSTVAATLTGTHFVAGATTVNVSGAGISVTNVVVGSAASLTANFVLDPAAAAGARTVTVTTAGGTSGGQTLTITPPPPPGPPTLTAVSPIQGIVGTTAVVTLTGANFVVGATTVNVSGAGVAVNNVVVGSTASLTANFVLDPAAAVGARTVTVTTAGGVSGGQPFVLTLPRPAGSPTLTNITPNQGIRGTTVAVALNGTNFVPGGTIVAVGGDGVKVTNVMVGSDTSMTANFVVDPAAAPGLRPVEITTSGGRSSTEAFTVSLPAPTLTSVSPNQGRPGATVAVTLIGTNFIVGTTSVNVSGSGISVTNVVAGTTTSLTADLVLDPVATIGPRAVTVTTAGGTSSAQTFTVTVPLPGTPTLTSVLPNQATQGTTAAVTLTGTNFVRGATTVIVGGSGVTVSNVAVGSSTSLTASFALDAAAAIGARAVTVTTVGGTSVAQTFTINPPPPTLTGIDPNQAIRGTRVGVILTGTSFIAGGTTVNVAGGGVTVTNVRVNSGTSLVVGFVLDLDTPPGPRTVTVTTAGGTSEPQTFTVLVPPPGSKIFSYSGSPSTFTVPAGVVSILIEAIGAAGGAGASGSSPGSGGRAVARISVTPGTSLEVRCGGQGQAGAAGSIAAGGYNGGGGTTGDRGGGGGGATSVHDGNNPLVIAGGGGGSGHKISGSGGQGGDGGGLTGRDGEINPGGGGGFWGSGGTQFIGGAGGAGAPNGTATAGSAGKIDGTGGTGGSNTPGVLGGGGGGGGYRGGGGGGGGIPGSGGGGGGSSFTAPGGTNVIHQQGVGLSGSVIISW